MESAGSACCFTATLARVILVVPPFRLLQRRTLVAIVAEQFPPSVRAASLEIGYQLSACIFGGLSPLTMTSLIDPTGNNLVPAIYATSAAVISSLALLTLRETRR